MLFLAYTKKAMHASDRLDQHFKRMKPDQKSALERLRISTVRDLLLHFPTRYESSGPTGHIASLTDGAMVTLYGTIQNPETKKAWKSKIPMSQAYLHDSSGKIKLIWFRQPYIAKMIFEGMPVKVSGKVSSSGSGLYLANPSVEKSKVLPEMMHETLFTDAVESERTLFPVYPETKGISSLWIAHAIDRILKSGVHETLPDPLPEDIISANHLPRLSTALVWIHAPKSNNDATAARKRFSFQEIFLVQIAVALQKRTIKKIQSLCIDVDEKKLEDFISTFPFKATDAQLQTIEDIRKDFSLGYPMRRLLEGDVGSGKTAVAAASAYMVATSRPPQRKFGTLQVAYMCPTEILAKQHFSTFVSFFKDHPIQIGLITGSECRKFPSKIKREESTKISRAQFKKWVANGEIPIVIGTHALVYKSIEFKHLAYTIIDEQHRFGTVHRQALAQKDKSAPHLLSMTATPIPRTLALTIYGDLDLSLLDQMPTGRKPIITEIVTPATREKAYTKIREELEAGRQAYVICPRIEEPDPTQEMALIAKSVVLEAKRLKEKVFQKYEVGVLHSKMTPAEKEKVMSKFEKNEIHILVATSVVEVGVNVPNATVILIEGAERFGLAQLHQLRGRVIRSSNQAYCFLLPEKVGEQTKNRLNAIVTAKNGFELAEHDLALRGSGEFSGARQWGVSDIAMEALKNIKLVELARKSAQDLLENDPDLLAHPHLKSLAEHTLKSIHPE
jgi:ATP-dependent DNA helicase RecG